MLCIFLSFHTCYLSLNPKWKQRQKLLGLLWMTLDDQSNPSTHPGSAAAATETWGCGLAEGRESLSHKPGFFLIHERGQKGGTQMRSARVRKGEVKESYLACVLKN